MLKECLKENGIVLNQKRFNKKVQYCRGLLCLHNKRGGNYQVIEMTMIGCRMKNGGLMKLVAIGYILMISYQFVKMGSGGCADKKDDQ